MTCNENPGCKLQQRGFGVETEWQVELCPLHAAADEMLKALIKVDNHWHDLHPKDKQQVNNAITASRAKANPRKQESKCQR